MFSIEKDKRSGQVMITRDGKDTYLQVTLSAKD
jgi:hypothetical protein